MLNPFVWVKNKMKQAVIEGFAEGLQAIDSEADPIEQRLPEALASRLLPAAPESEEAPRQRKKAGAA